MDHYAFTVAGMTFEVQAPLSPELLGLPARYGQFADGAAGAGKARIRWQEQPRFDPLPVDRLLYDPGSIWRMYRTPRAEGVIADIDYAEQAERGESLARLTANSTWDDCLLEEREQRPAVGSVLTYGAGELIFRTRILLHDGLVFHASGLDDNGKGLLFVGHSGAGKSTQIGLWSREPGVVPMNDDRVAVRMLSDGPMLYGTPWGGTANIACNHQAPLSAILILQQARENRLEPLNPAAAIPLLLTRSFLPYWDHALLERAMSLIERLVECAPIYRLHCRPELAVIPLVRGAV